MIRATEEAERYIRAVSAGLGLPERLVWRARAESGSTIRIGRPSRRAWQPSRAPYWLVARGKSRDAEILTIGGSCGRVSTLPIFGFKEGVAEFVRCFAKGGRWQARPAGKVELLSLLGGSHADVECVALDPSPEIVAERALALVSLTRQSFVDSLLGRGRPYFESRHRKEGGVHR